MLALRVTSAGRHRRCGRRPRSVAGPIRSRRRAVTASKLPAMRALALIALVVVLAFPGVAAGQDEGGGDAFGPLPAPAAPTPNPQPVTVPQEDDGSSERATLYVIAGG